MPFVYVLLLNFGAVHAAFDDLPRGSLATATGRDYAAVRDLTLDLAREFPPARHHFVNVSQVSTPVIAMLKAIYGTGAARNLPLSYLKHLQPPGIRVLGRFGDPPPTDEAYRALRAKLYTPEIIGHFRDELTRALPTAAELGDRRLVFVDWANEGLTITNLARELSAYRGEAPARCPKAYDLVGLTHGRGLLPDVLRAQNVRVKVLRGRARTIFDARLYRDFAEYGAYLPGDEAPPPPRPVFDDLVAVYRDVGRQDPVVRAARGERLAACDRLIVGGAGALGRVRAVLRRARF